MPSVEPDSTARTKESSRPQHACRQGEDPGFFSRRSWWPASPRRRMGFLGLVAFLPDQNAALRHRISFDVGMKLARAQPSIGTSTMHSRIMNAQFGEMSLQHCCITAVCTFASGLSADTTANKNIPWARRINQTVNSRRRGSSTPSVASRREIETTRNARSRGKHPLWGYPQLPCRLSYRHNIVWAGRFVLTGYLRGG